MKKILLVSIVIVLTSCNHFFHSPNYHLELLKAKAAPTQYESGPYEFRSAAEATCIIKLSEGGSKDSTRINLFRKPNRATTPFSHSIQTYSAKRKLNSLTVREQAKQETKPGDETEGKKKTNTLALLSLIFGILSLVFFPAAIAAIILGRKALYQLRLDPTQKGLLLAQIGIALGAAALILLLVSIVFLLITISTLK